jgi:hypothetical protein
MEAAASWFSIVTLGWLTPLLSLSYAKPLEATDPSSAKCCILRAYADGKWRSSSAMLSRVSSFRHQTNDGDGNKQI